MVYSLLNMWKHRVYKKMVEKYGFGTKDEGRAVALAKNISMNKSYPRPQRVQVLEGPIK